MLAVQLEANATATVAPTEQESKAARKRIKDVLATQAAAGRGNPAFERLMRSALNSRTDKILGWDKPAAL